MLSISGYITDLKARRFLQETDGRGTEGIGRALLRFYSHEGSCNFRVKGFDQPLLYKLRIPSISAKLAFIEPYQPRQTLLNPVAVKASRNAMWNMDARFRFFADVGCI